MRNKTKKSTLTTNEFHLICDCQNGSINNLRPINYMELFVSDISESMMQNPLEEKWEVDGPLLLQKLEALSERELLELMISIDEFWQRKDDFYSRLKHPTPASVLENLEKTQ